MVQSSFLNWLICILVLLGITELISIRHQHSDAEIEKSHAKQKLNNLLHQLDLQIKEFNRSVSNLQQPREQHRAAINSQPAVTPTVPPAESTKSVSNVRTLPTKSKSSGGLFVPPISSAKLEKSLISSTGPAVLSGKRALLFTMDSISSYEANSKNGGAAGEILIRHSLEHAFQVLGVRLDVMRSDAEFLRAKGDQYDMIIVDPWTWAAKGWVPKPVLRNQIDKVYVLDFFGSQRLPREKPDFKVPASRFLTAFGYPGNKFLGYFIDRDVFNTHRSTVKKQQGVIWGKDPNHFKRRNQVLSQVADLVPLHSTASRAVFRHSNVVWHGHQNKDGWMQLLSESKFLLGLGDPLLGPSAIDAISMGCVYINAIYDSPVRGHFKTQHDYAVNHIGAPYVCNANLDDIKSVKACVDFALKNDLPPFIPPDFEHEAYISRVKGVFSLP